MAYTPEQEFQLELETQRAKYQEATEARRTRFDAIRLAKEVLIDNARNKPAEESEVTVQQITKFADELIRYIGD